MKVYSIALRSTNGSNKRALYTSTLAKDLPDAMQKAIEETTNVFGNLGWVVELKNEVNFEEEEGRIVPVQSVEEDSTKQSKNWLLNTIVTYFDRTLFKSAKKYLTKSEIAYVEEKLKLKTK